jgi:hypothetical protein
MPDASKHSFTTGISRPQPVQPGDRPAAARPQAPLDEGVATGISRPQPAQR